MSFSWTGQKTKPTNKRKKREEENPQKQLKVAEEQKAAKTGHCNKQSWTESSAERFLGFRKSVKY